MGHLPMIITSAVVCGALKILGIVCAMQYIDFYKTLVIDMLFAAGIWRTRLILLAIVLYMLATIVDCCGCFGGNAEERFWTVYNTVHAKSTIVRDVKKAILPPPTGIKANKHNITAILGIAEVKPPLTKYNGTQLRRPQLLKHFTQHCTVNGVNATENDINAAFTKANIVYDPDGLKLFLVDALKRLGLV
jgi:hypothetical protein